MNKKDFWTLAICNITTFILLIECCFGVPFAFEFMCGSALVSLVTHIIVLCNYLHVPIFVKKDYTR